MDQITGGVYDTRYADATDLQNHLFAFRTNAIMADENRRQQLLDELKKKLNKSSTKEDDNPQSKSKLMKGNKLAQKDTRAIDIGWIHRGSQVFVFLWADGPKNYCRHSASAGTCIVHV